MANAANDAKKTFAIASGEAAKTLKQFAEQAGREIIFHTPSVAGIKTNSLRGAFTVREGIDRLLAGTELRASEDAQTGGLMIKRANPPNGEGTVQTTSARSSREGAATESNGDNGTPPTSAGRSAADDMLVLSPFEVVEDSDKSYGALNSNSITRFNVELEKMPVSADILNETFMTDVAAWGVEELLRDYSAGAGLAGADPSANAENNNPLDRVAVTDISLRGMGAPTTQRDAFLPAGNGLAVTATGFTSNFDVERVEVINGPQSLLYGFSGAGGAINLVSKQARLGKPRFGSFRYQVNQHGHKMGSLDLGIGTKDVAVRLAATRQQLGNRRLYIGGLLDGLYSQVAVRLPRSTVARFTVSDSDFLRVYQSAPTLTAQSTANDARNGLSLRYLLATGQIHSAANGPSGAGAIANGNVTWDNVDSFAGSALAEHSRARRYTLTADTVWSRAFSTQIALGYNTGQTVRFANGGPQFVAPNVTANTLGTWATSPNTNDLRNASRGKAIRGSGVWTHGIPRTRARSTTAFGADYVRVHRTERLHGYALADASGNPIINPSPTAAANGFMLMPRMYFPVSNGPDKYPRWEPGALNVSVNNRDYVYLMTNRSDPALVSENNPLGLTGRGQGAYRVHQNVVKGAYMANFTEWLDNRLTTLIGARVGEVHALRGNEGTIAEPSVLKVAKSSAVSFNAGINYRLRDWVHPYIAVSDSHNPPSNLSSDPHGGFPENSHGAGGEVGLKFSNREKTLSGSLAIYRASSRNEQYTVPASIADDINPNGLNGRYNAPSNLVNVDRKSTGAQLAVTANPRPHWRIRLSASTIRSVIGTDTSFAQLYNDQFYANAAGQVTYRNGTPVYVSPTATQVATATTPGAVPLTIGMMNDPTNRYYANPDAGSAQINSASAAATILETSHPVNGPILTGAVGLPISELQIAPRPGAPPLPGVVIASKSGDLSTGNPKLAVNITSLYTFPSGLLKGVRLGGTVSKAWKVTSYYYYENGISATAPRILHYNSIPFRCNLILGYERRLGRYGLSTQVNITNVFNQYDVVFLPSTTTGFNDPRGAGIRATFNVEPRMYVWSATVSF